MGSVYGRALLLYRGLMASSERERGGGGGRTTVERFFFFFFHSLAAEKERNDFKFKSPKSFKCTFRKTFLKKVNTCTINTVCNYAESSVTYGNMYILLF